MMSNHSDCLSGVNNQKLYGEHLGSMDPLCKELENTWHQKIPLSEFMQLHIDAFDNNVLVTTAKFAPNVNIHGTAFAGSLYSAQALTAWGMIWLQLKREGIDASIVLASGNVEYIKPLTDDLVTCCDFNDVLGSIVELKRNGKARFQLHCTVNGQEGIASQFVGDYAVKLKD